MIKRISSLIFALLLSTAVLASCAEDKESAESNNSKETTNTVETKEPETTPFLDAQTALDAIFTPFADKMAPAFGVESGEEVKGAFSGSLEGVPGPAAIDLNNLEEGFFHLTILPTENVDKLASASLFTNMMNQNNGTVVAFELKNADEAQALADILKTSVAGNQWMCGFPERHLIVNVDGVVFSAYGLADVTNALKDAITETYENAVVLHDEAL